MLHDLRGGGAERVMLNLAKGMLEAGRSVTLILVNAEGDYLQQIPPAATVINLGRPNVFRAVPDMISYLRRNPGVTVLSALPHVNVALLLAKLISRAPARVVVSEHNHISWKSRGRKNLRQRITYFLVPLLYRLAHRVIAVSQGVGQDIKAFAHLPKGRVICIYNPSYSRRILQQSREPPDHPWFGDGGPDIILAAGRLHKQKAYDVMLRAVAIVRRSKDVRLLVLGEGEERAALQALALELGIEGAVSFAGFAANPYAMMARARMFVMSSAWEGLPTVLIEALACNLPIVSTDCPSGPREILDGGRYGRLVPVGDPIALAEAIGQCLEEPRKSDGRSRAECYSVEASTQAYLEVLEA